MSEHNIPNRNYGKLTRNDFYKLIKEDSEFSQKVNEVATNGFTALGEKALEKIKETIGLTGNNILKPVELPISAFFYCWGLSDNNEGKDEVELLWDAGKFVVLSVASGPLGLALGIPSLALRVIGYLNKKEKDEKEQRWQDIANSMNRKYIKINLQVIEKKSKLLAREIMNDANNRAIWNPASKENLSITVEEHAVALMIFDKFLTKTFHNFSAEIKEKYRQPIKYPALVDIEHFVHKNSILINNYHHWTSSEKNHSKFIKAIEIWASDIVDDKDNSVSGDEGHAQHPYQ